MANKYNVFAVLMIGNRFDKDGIKESRDEIVLPKACDLYEASYGIAATRLKLSPKLRELATVEAKKHYSGPVSPQKLRSLMTKEVAFDQMRSYARGEWSLLSDKPTRPITKVAEPATLDA